MAFIASSLRVTEDNLVFETVQFGPYSSFECFLCSLRNYLLYFNRGVFISHCDAVFDLILQSTYFAMLQKYRLIENILSEPSTSKLVYQFASLWLKMSGVAVVIDVIDHYIIVSFSLWSISKNS